MTLNNFNNFFIFTGPSLSHEEARKIMPEAHYHAPIQCGDVIKALRAGAQKIIIIDGYFEQKGAVWHKEIIFALSQGVLVYGTSSMGALRAAELHTLGMVGYGKIFELYKNNLTLDDDEVALVHSDAEFESRITPMVNIRATFENAVQENIVSPQQAEILIQQFKDQAYYNRSIFNSIDFFNTPDLLKLQSWLKENYVDQKKQDAQNLLLALKNTNLKNTPETLETPDFPGGLFFNRIFREMITEPFDLPYEWLPIQEKNLAKLKTQDSHALFLLQRLAKCLHLGLDISVFNQEAVLPHEVYHYLCQPKFTSHCPVSLDFIYQALLIENKENKNNKNLIQNLGDIYRGFLGFMSREKLSISPVFIQKYADEFRREHELISIEKTMSWMQENNLKTPEEFEKFICVLAPMHHIIDLHNAHSIGLQTHLICYSWLNNAEELINNLNNLKTEKFNSHLISNNA